MQLFLGIDGGQSSTTVLIGDAEGRVIGWARGGPCNHVTAAEAAAKFKSVVLSTVDKACSEAGLRAGDVRFESACCGMSGGPEDKESLIASVIRADRLVVVTDGETALAGAMAGGPGVIVVAGTGSIAFGRNDARIIRSGGWGYVFGDEGSAFDIARQALRAALRFEEGWGTPTALRAAFLDATGALSANRIMHLFYTPEWPRSRVATLSALVDSVATDGDAVARAILEQSAQTLAALGGSVRQQLFSDGDEVRVAPVGGVFRSRTLSERFRMLVELTDGCHCIQPVLDPAAGALLEAYRAVGRTVILSDVPMLK
jgi:N-acetylglucosamine kinase-like BadF-type ATPase